MTTDCWNQIGISGDRSCERLEAVGHCSNCPVYAAAGLSLLDREIPLDYLQEWTQTLAQPLASPRSSASTQLKRLNPEHTGTLAAMIFRLGSERFALPVSVLQEVIRPVPIHTLPHRSTSLFLGLVNHRGEILPCASLSQFLQVEMPIDPTYSRVNRRRMMVIRRPETCWVFPVDEVYRVHRFQTSDLQEPPVVVARAQQSYTQGIIDWHDGKVNYLDADRLLITLDRRLL
jgi:chemotaxis-related protein WspD